MYIHFKMHHMANKTKKIKEKDMKKLFLALMISVMLVCLFVIGISAAQMNPEYNEQYVKSMTSNMTTVTLEDGSIVELYDEQGYTLCYYWDDVASADRKLLSVRTKDLTFNFNETRLSSIYYGDEHLAGTAKAGKIVVVNLRGLKNSSGQDITDFNGDNMFKEDSPLQHIFMPDTIEHLTGYAFGHRDGSLSHLRGCYFSENSKLQEIKSNTFMNARQLRGFYIPNGVTYVGTNGFQGCHNAFFVNDPYDFLTKPRVYYFPDGLYKAEGEAFDSLKHNLNEVLVFSADNITITNQFAFEVVQCDANGTKPTIVFKGNVSSISIGYWNVNAIYFANENDVDVTSAGVSGNKTMYFCHADGNTTHLAEKTVDIFAQCEIDAGVATVCFCGYEISKESVEGSALSHDYDYLNNDKAILVEIVYSNYLQDGIKTVICANCGQSSDLTAPALFGCLGYSAAQYGDAQISVNYRVDEQAIVEYEAFTGISVSYGVFAVMADKIGNNNIFNENGASQTGVIAADITNCGFTLFSLKIVGFTSEQKEIDLAIGAFVGTTLDGVTEYAYLQIAAPAEGEKYFVASYNDVLALLPPDNDEVA